MSGKSNQYKAFVGMIHQSSVKETSAPPIRTSRGGTARAARSNRNPRYIVVLSSIVFPFRFGAFGRSPYNSGLIQPVLLIQALRDQPMTGWGRLGSLSDV